MALTTLGLWGIPTTPTGTMADKGVAPTDISLDSAVATFTVGASTIAGTGTSTTALSSSVGTWVVPSIGVTGGIRSGGHHRLTALVTIYNSLFRRRLSITN